MNRTRLCLTLGVLSGLFTVLVPLTASAQSGKTPGACPALLSHSFPRLQDEAPQNLCQYAGKEALHAKYEKRGLVILGFPANDFGQQEPGNAKAIADLCFNTYGVRFPMFSKTAVVGAQRNAFYTQLFQATKAAPQWNFHKYLIARDGKAVSSFQSAVEPGSEVLTSAIETALRQTP